MLLAPLFPSKKRISREINTEEIHNDDDDDALIDFSALLFFFFLKTNFFSLSQLFHSTEPTGAANSKSAAIEMYAPSSYNDTVTGETLSSVSDKSDSYSNDGSQPDLTVNKFCYRRIVRMGGRKIISSGNLLNWWKNCGI
jgi:hypothetical protein